MTNTKKIVSLILNLAVVCMEVVALCIAWPNRGFGVFIFFTELSNLFGAIACLCLSVYLIRSLATGKAVPQWVRTFKYLGACALALTFFTVIFVLAPGAGGTKEAYIRYLTYGSMLYTHTLNPLFVMLTFLFLDDFETKTVKVAFLGLIPTLFYEVVSITMNILRLWDGPYFFLKVLSQPVYMSIMWAILMTAFSFGLCAGLYGLKKLRNR